MTTGSLLPPLEMPSKSALERHADMLALALVLIGLTLRLGRLEDGLWYDEIRTLVAYVRQPLGTIITDYGQNQHMFYSVLARISFLLLGESATALRLPAVLLGTGSLWALYRFASAVTGAREALLATALLALSYHHIWFSQNARGYTGLMLGCLVASSALWRLLTEPKAGPGVVWTYALAIALAAYTHVTAVFVLVAQAVVVAVAWWRVRRIAPRAGWRPATALVLSGLLMLLLYAPIIPQLADTPFRPGAESVKSEWYQPGWFVAEMVRGVLQGLPGGRLALVVGLVVGCAGFFSFARRSWALALMLTLPAAVTAGVAVALGHTLRPRFLFFAGGFALMIAIRGTFATLRAVAPRAGHRLATAVLVLGIAASALRVPTAWGAKQDYAAAARFIDREAAPGDAVVTIDVTAYPYAAYFGRAWVEVRDSAQLATIESGHARTWLLYTFPISLAASYAPVWNHLQARYDTAQVFPGTVGDGAIVVMVSRTPAMTDPPTGR